MTALDLTVLHAQLLEARLQADSLAAALQGLLMWPEVPDAQEAARAALAAHAVRSALKEYAEETPIQPPKNQWEES